MRNIDQTNGCSSLFSRAGKKLLATTAMTAMGLLSFSGNAQAANDSANDWSDHVYDGGSVGGSLTVTVDAPNSTTNIDAVGSVVKARGDGDLKAGWTANVNQDNASAKYILFDVEGDASRINGNLNANGQVFVFDQDGVIFGANSVVNVGSIVASSGSLASTDAELDAGKIIINSVATDGDVRTNGTITVAEAGLAAFVAPNVSNSGVINAKMATVAMAAGQTVTLDMYGDGLVEVAVDGELADGLLRNIGDIKANGGNVLVSAAIAKDAVQDVINMAGVTTVSSAQVKGGKIILSGGSSGRVNVRGALNANGVGGQDAGSVDVRGERVRVASTGRVRANAQPDGAAGEINVIADKTMIIDGRLSAQGLAGTGDIETSAPIALFGAGASILATREWILDPTDVDINGGSILESLIEGQLAAGNMTVATPAGGADAGNIALRTVIDWFTANTFKLVAHNDIFLSGVGGGINAAGGGDFVAEAGDDFRMNAGNSSIIMNGGSVDITAADEFTLDDGFILAGGGDITIDNAESFQAAANSLRTSGTGSITINQNKDANGNTTTTDATIQNAVNAILNTGTGASRINLGAGTWAESTTVDRAVSIVGDNQTTTFITPGAGNDGFTIDGTIDGNVALLKMNISGGRDGVHVNDTADVKGLVINKVDFEDNSLRGVAVFGDSVNSTVIKNASFLNNGSGSTSNGDGDILFYLHNGNIKLQNVDIQGNTGGAADYGIQIRGSDTFAQSGKLKFINVKVAGAYRAAQLGIQRFTGLNTLEMTNVELGGQTDAGTDSAGWGSLYFSNIGTGDFSIGNTSFNGGPSPFFQHIINDSEVNFDATGATFGGIAAADLTVEESFGVEDKVFHKLDLASRGLVTWQDGNVFVTQASNNFSGGGGIQRGVDASDVGGNVWVDDGTFAESVNVNKTVNLFGNNHGLPGSDGSRGPESIVTPNSPGFLVTANDVVIDGFAIDGADNGVKVDGADRVEVANNVITNSTENGVYIVDSEDADVTGNAITTTTDEGILVEDSDGYTVDSNTVTDTGENGIKVVSSDNGFVQGNVVSDTGHNGIVVIDSDNATVNMTNVVYDTFSAGISLNRTTNSLVDGNDISNTGGSGVWINRADGSTVSDNEIDTTGLNPSRSTHDGVHVKETEDAIVSGNDIKNTGQNGIAFVSSNNGQILNNIINSTDDDGVDVEDSDGTLIKGNKIGLLGGADNIGDDGIDLDDSDNTTIRNNNIQNVVENGIDNRNSHGTDIIDNIIRFAGLNGVYVNPSNDIRILDNVITDVDEDGIHSEEGLDIRVRRNTIRRTGDDGVDITRNDYVRVTGNTVTDTDKRGISVERSKNEVEEFSVAVADNTVRRTGRTGIVVDRFTTARVVDNVVTDSNRAGIRVQRGDDARIRRNTVRDSRRDGIKAVNLDQVDIRRNTIRRAGWDGIRLEDFGDAWIAYNDIKWTGDDGVDVHDGDFVSIYDNYIDLSGYLPNTDPVPANVEVGEDANGIHVFNVGDSDEEMPPVGAAEGFGYASYGAAVEIHGNEVANSEDDGIQVEKSESTYIAHNVVGHTGDDGVDVDGTDIVIVRDNAISSTEDRGITIHGGRYAGVFDNRVLLTVDDGIHVGSVYGGTDAEKLGDVVYGYGWSVNVSGNEVAMTGEDGIEVHDSGPTKVQKNKVFMAGMGKGLDKVITVINDFANETFAPVFTISVASLAADPYHGFEWNWGDGHGINVNNVEGAYNSPNGWAADIRGNNVKYTGGHGILAESNDRTRIKNNKVKYAGIDYTGFHGAYNMIEVLGSGPFDRANPGRRDLWLSEGSMTDVLEGYFGVNDPAPEEDPYISISDIGFDSHDGIHAENINGRYDDGISGKNYLYDLKIKGNTVKVTGDDGIEVYGAGRTLIAENTIRDSGYGDKRDYGSGDRYGADGISVHNVSAEISGRIKRPTLGGLEEGEEGYEYERPRNYALIIRDNDIRRTADDGIEVVGGERRSLGRLGISGITDVPTRGPRYYGTTDRVLIAENTVRRTGDRVETYDASEEEILGPDLHGRDGIHVRGITGDIIEGIIFPDDEISTAAAGAGGEGPGGFYGYAVDIIDNDVRRTGDDAIEVVNSTSTLILGNTVRNAGVGGGYNYGSGDYYGADGIHVRNVGGSGSVVWLPGAAGAGAGGIGFQPYAVAIAENDVRRTADDGIEVVGERRIGDGDGDGGCGGDGSCGDGSTCITGDGDGWTGDGWGDGDGISFGGTGRTLIVDNLVRNAGYFDVEHEGDDVKSVYRRGDGHGADGIHVRGVQNNFIVLAAQDVSVTAAGFSGGPYAGYDIEISGNDVKNSADDGIEVLAEKQPGYIYGGGTSILVDGNHVENSGDNGINILAEGGFFMPTLNAVSAVSLFGPSEINSVVSNNTVINSENNGLYIEGPSHDNVEVSGNIFTDNDIGAHFESGLIDLTGDRNVFENGRVGMRFSPAIAGYEYPEFDTLAFAPLIGDPIFANMELVDNTIGAQTFDGQSDLYVELDNGAFFDPGTPTLLNALDSTYVGTPFGTVTPSVDFPAGFSVAQLAFFESMFQHFNDDNTLGLFFFPLLPEIDQEDILKYFGPNASSLSGLNLTILGLPGIPGGSPVALNNIAPAAGGDTSPEALNAIATAAGGEDGGSTSGCYGDALSIAEGGQPATVSYGGSAEDLLNSEAACGS